MDVTITKDAYKLICLIYKEYLVKSKTRPKSEAKFFTFDEISSLMPDEYKEDILEFVIELSKENLLDNLDLTGNAILSSKAIVYMETKIGKTIDKIVDYIGKLKP